MLLDFETTASIPIIMNKLKSQIQVSESLPLAFKGVLYQSSISSNRITYAFGHKATPKIFEVEVVLKDTGSSVKCVLKVLRWVESSGLVNGREEIKKLRKQVLLAFKAADAAGENEETFPGSRIENQRRLQEARIDREQYEEEVRIEMKRQEEIAKDTAKIRESKRLINTLKLLFISISFIILFRIIFLLDNYNK